MSWTIRRQYFTSWDRDQIGRARSESINQLTYVDTTPLQISCVSIYDVYNDMFYISRWQIDL